MHDPKQRLPRQALGRGSPCENGFRGVSIGCTLKETEDAIVWVEICVLWPPVTPTVVFRTKFAKMCFLRPSGLRTLIAPPRTCQLRGIFLGLG